MKSFQTQFFLTPIIVAFLYIFQIGNIYAQWVWSDPLPLTNNSGWNHRNVDLIPAGNNNVWIAYEKYTDTLSTSIYIQEILNNGDPIEIISGETVHYSNPKFFSHYSFNQTDTSFFLFFETSENGNKDLNYIAYLNNGEILGPFPFFNTVGDEYDLDLSFYDPRLIWISDGNLMRSKYQFQNGGFVFTDPIILDSGNCLNPKISEMDIFYIKQTDSTSYIYEYSSEKAEKDIIFDQGYAVNLDKDGLGMPYLTWSAKTDNLWYLYTWNPWLGYSPQFEYNTIPYDPAICSFQIGSKSSSLMDDIYLAFPYDTAGNQEIFMNLEPGNPNFINFSSSETMNRNPRSFYGEPYGYACFYGYMIWESLQDDRWQFYYSKILMCVGGVEENESDESFIQVSPNPFSRELNISYVLDNRSKVKIEIADMYGKVISTLIDEPQNKGKQSIYWSPSQEIANGVYFIILRKDNEIFSQKIIKSD